MADLLGATNPVPGYDNNTINRQAPISHNDLKIQNIPDPSRVGRPDARTDKQDGGDAASTALPRYDSNYHTFLQRLKDAPDLAGELSRILLSRRGTVVSSGLGEGLATEMSHLMEMLRMDQGQLLQFMANQLKSGSRFGGALFDVLRGAYFGSQSEAAREDILQFLKKYADYSATAHLEKNMLRNLNGMIDSVPSSWRDKLLGFSALLQNGIAAGDREGNLKLLQGELFPYMGDYVERTHDLGTPRTLLSMLALDIARYESGSENSVIQAFHQLLGYAGLRDRLGGIEDNILLRLLNGTSFANASQENQFADQLAATAACALGGEGGVEAQDAFRQVISAMLINESVYMPLNHVLLPMEWDGRMMFSELWIDPDAENGSERRSGEEGENTLRFLFKMDIENAGLYDILLNCKGSQVDLAVSCPERIAPFSKLIQEDMAAILRENGLVAQTVQVERLGRSRTLTEVFPKIFEGKNSVNVKI